MNTKTLPLLAFSLCLLVSGCSHGSSPIQEETAEASMKKPEESIDIRTERISRRTISENLRFTGQISSDLGKETDVESRFSGRVLKVDVQPGQKLVPGQILTVVDSHEISSLEAELIEARAQLAIAHAHAERERQVYEENMQRPQSLIQARTLKDRTHVLLTLAEAEFKRLDGLRKEKIASEKDFLSAQANLEQARLAFKEAQTQLQREEALFKNKGILRKDLQLAEAEVKREQQHVNTLIQRLEFLGMPPELIHVMATSNKIVNAIPIKSRVYGTVTQQDIAVGELIQPGKRVFTITDLSTVIVNVDVPEVDLQWIKMGTPATVSVASYPGESFNGHVSYISDTVNPETRTVAVRVRLDNKGHKLKLNMFAEIFLKADPHAVVACPRSAVQDKDGAKIVFVKQGSEYKPVRVSLGLDTEQYFEVLSGLDPGVEVVTQGSLLLKTEMTYKPTESPAEQGAEPAAESKTADH